MSRLTSLLFLLLSSSILLFFSMDADTALADMIESGALSSSGVIITHTVDIVHLWIASTLAVSEGIVAPDAQAFVGTAGISLGRGVMTIMALLAIYIVYYTWKKSQDTY